MSVSENANGSRGPGRDSSVNNSSIASYLHRHGYRLGKIIGEGSYSKVRLTTRYFPDGASAYRLASKVIDKKKASEDFVTKFLPRELEIVSKLNHPNIVRVYDVVEFGDHVYIFMDWCDKGDLLEFIKAKGFISENKSRHYFLQLTSAVQYLHNQDLAHRDLKCENVLMATQDEIRISDFGFARSCRDGEGRRILSNTYCGSAAYAAPEILQGTHYNPKLYDMWSLGCVLFIMLTGHMPYDESNISRMLKNQLDRTLTYPARVYESISDKAKSCIRRLLEPDVTRRANIEQILTHDWVLRKGIGSSRPSSAANGDGDTRQSEDLPGLLSPRTSHGDHGLSGSKSKRFQKKLEPPERVQTRTQQQVTQGPTTSRTPRPRPSVEQSPRTQKPVVRNPKTGLTTNTSSGNGSIYRPTSKGPTFASQTRRPNH